MSSEFKVYEGKYQGEDAIWLKAGSYEAALLPKFGANLIALRDVEQGYQILREPAEHEMDEFRANPGVHGIPVLFPPNRYEDGKFPWNGKVYQFPVNEADTQNHLHGFLHTAAWTVESYGVEHESARVTMSITVDEQHPIYEYFPHTFTMKLTYTLNEAGLHQHAYVRNEGKESMPCLLAFHTAINAPFDQQSSEQDIDCFVTLGERFELNERMLPTGAFQPLNEGEQQMKSTGVSPFFEVMDHHYTAAPQHGRNRMELRDQRTNQTLVYDVGTAYKFWMVWNKDASSGFICCEPHINMVNAPNLLGASKGSADAGAFTAEDLGLVGLEPGEIWEETSRIYVK